MPEISATKRRGIAEPRWRWSGVAAFAAAQLSASDIDLPVLLPGHRGPIEQIVLVLRDLGGRYRRYLHQDEFGPTRAERMAALRELRDHLDLLLSRLNGLPGDLRQRLSTQLAPARDSVEGKIDPFQAHCSDEATLEQVGEAATEIGCIVHPAATTHDPQLIDDIRDAAEGTRGLLAALDTTTAGAVVLDSKLPPLEIADGDESDLIGFAIVCARIDRLRCRVEQTLAGLERRRGPERFENLPWLVWELCELYRRETGRPVTNSALSKDKYTSKPQSPAGRFVLAAVKALQPSEAWRREPDHLIERRARVLDEFVIERAVLNAMRAYVAHHSSSGGRRGRWKRRRVTL